MFSLKSLLHPLARETDLLTDHNTSMQRSATSQALKLLRIYLNSEMAATIRDANELKIFAWDNEDV